MLKAKTLAHEAILPMTRAHLPRRSANVIGPAEAECLPLRLVALRNGKTVELRQATVVVGRHSEADLQILEPDISRFHCHFCFRDGQWYVEDLDSLNGTHVNGMAACSAALQHNDMVRLGPVMFQIDLGNPEEEAGTEAGGLSTRRSQTVLRSIAACLPEDLVDEEALLERRSA